jgi:hypothetical protein
MALDTQNKRRSILGIKPVPDSELDSNDRIQFMDWFSGIFPIVERFFFWRKDGRNSTNFNQDGDSSDPFVKGKHSGGYWVPVLDFPEDQ